MAEREASAWEDEATPVPPAAWGVLRELDRLLAVDSVWASPRDRVRAITLRGWTGTRPGGQLTAAEAAWGEALRRAAREAAAAYHAPPKGRR